MATPNKTSQKEKEMTTTKISPKNPESRWVALDKNNNIISEGKTPNEVIQSAKKKIQDFSVMFIPAKGNTYIF